MSDELAFIEGPHEISLTKYFGGVSKGTCVQITGYTSDPQHVGYVGITKEEAKQISVHLSDFAAESEPLTLAQERLSTICKGIETVLLEKNRRYGNSATKPVNAFSALPAEEGIKIRLDDKLKRIITSTEKGNLPAKNDVFDLMGYLILYAETQEWVDFSDLLD